MVRTFYFFLIPIFGSLFFIIFFIMNFCSLKIFMNHHYGLINLLILLIHLGYRYLSLSLFIFVFY